MQKQMLLSQEEVPELMRKLNEGLGKNQIELWFRGEEMEDKARQLGVSGSILAPGCQQLFGTSNCQSDSLYYFVTDLVGLTQATMPKMHWQEEVTLRSGGVTHENKLVWESEGGGSAGRYYLQLYLPQKAKEVSLLVDGVQTHLDDENGLLVDFEGKSKVTVAVSYVLAGLEEEGEGLIYTYLQPAPVGLDGVKVDLRVKSELGKPFKLISPVATQEDMTLKFTGRESEDLFVTVGF
jgi:hypothetical protein